MKLLILVEFESVFLPLKDDKDKITELEEMCRVLIALDILGAHIMIYTLGDKNEVLQFFSYFAPSILSPTDVIQTDSELDTKSSLILSAINYHNQVSPESERITDHFDESIIVLDGDPNFICRLIAHDAPIRVKAYPIDNTDNTHRSMLESLHNSVFLNATSDAVAAKARKNREEAILNNDQKLLRLGYDKLVIDLKSETYGALSALIREVFYYLLLRCRLVGHPSASVPALQNISEFFLKLGTKEREGILAEVEQQLDGRKIPSNQEFINFLALQYRYNKCSQMLKLSQLPSVDEFLRLSVDKRSAIIEKTELSLAQQRLPTQQDVSQYLTLRYCCAEHCIENASPSLHEFLVLDARSRDQIVAQLQQKLTTVPGFHLPILSEHLLSELIAVALHEPMTTFLLQYIPRETLKHIYLASFPEIQQTLLDSQRVWLLDHPVTQLKVGDDKYKLLILKLHVKAKINNHALNEAMEAYVKLLDHILVQEKQFLQETTLSFLQLLSKYTAQTESAMREKGVLEDQIAECKDELDKKREEISKEFEEVVRPKEKENLRGTIIGRREEIGSDDQQYLEVFKACRDGNLDKLITAISKIGAAFDIHYAYTANNNRTLLDIACLHAHEAIVKHLVEVRKADVNCQISGAAPLVYALRGLHHYPARIEIIRILLERGARLNSTTTDNSGNTPLHIAAQQGNARGVELLAQWMVGNHPENGFSINAINCEDRTALLEAIYADRRCKLLPVIETLLSYGMCLRSVDIAYLRSHPNFNHRVLSAISTYIQNQANEFDASQNRTSPSQAANVINDQSAQSANTLLPAVSPRTRRSSFMAAMMPGRSSAVEAQQLASSISTVIASESPRSRSGSISYNSASSMSPVSPRRGSIVEHIEAPLSPRLPSANAAAAINPNSPTIRRMRSNSVKGLFASVFSSSRENSPARSHDITVAAKNPVTLFEAVQAKDPESVKRILKELSNKQKLSMAYVRDEASGRTALQEAVMLGEKECIKCFYEAGICLGKLDSQMLMAMLTIEARRILMEVMHEIAWNYTLDDSLTPRSSSAVTSPRRIHPV